MSAPATTTEGSTRAAGSSAPPALGVSEKRARLEHAGGRSAALELGIASDDDDDDVDDDSPTDVEEDEDTEGDPEGGAESEVSRAQLVRRRLARMRELHGLYRDQYWRLLETLRRRHRRFALRNGHGGRKEDGLAETAAREKMGLPAQCEREGCEERPVPLAKHCFAHILDDPDQKLYAPENPEADPKDQTPVLNAA